MYAQCCQNVLETIACANEKRNSQCNPIPSDNTLGQNDPTAYIVLRRFFVQSPITTFSSAGGRLESIK